MDSSTVCEHMLAMHRAEISRREACATRQLNMACDDGAGVFDCMEERRRNAMDRVDMAVDAMLEAYVQQASHGRRRRQQSWTQQHAMACEEERAESEESARPHLIIRVPSPPQVSAQHGGKLLIACVARRKCGGE